MSPRRGSFLVAGLLLGSALCLVHQAYGQDRGYGRTYVGQAQQGYQDQGYDDRYRRESQPVDAAYLRGQQDGAQDAQADARKGRRVDPARNDHYEDTPGYNRNYGDKGQYQAAYRQGYLQGYQQGYQQGPGYGQGYAPGRGRDYDGDRDGRDGPYAEGNGGGYGQGGYGVDPGQARANRAAFENGERAGRYDAQRDIRGNKQNVDFTDSDLYSKAPGWDAWMGDRNQYKQAFRQGYAAGYKQTWAEAQGYFLPR